MKLTREQRKELDEALRSAFDEATLRRMLSFRLEKRLDEISSGQNLSITVFEIIDNAERYGWIEELIREAYLENPHNPKLSAFTTKMGLIPTQPESESLPQIAITPPPLKVRLAYAPEVPLYGAAFKVRIYNKGKFVESISDIKLILPDGIRIKFSTIRKLNHKLKPFCLPITLRKGEDTQYLFPLADIQKSQSTLAENASIPEHIEIFLEQDRTFDYPYDEESSSELQRLTIKGL